MKKLLALLLTLTFALGLLAGCGQTEPASTEGEETTETQTTEQNGDAQLRKIVITEQVRGYHWAPAYLAQTLGYFAEEGLDAEFQTIKGGDATAPVLSGDAQFCLKGIETALMVNEAGQGCKVVVSTTQKYPYQLVGASEEYSTIESLKGQVVAGGQSTNSGPYSFAKACIASAGLDPDSDVNVTTMASSGYAAAIENGELQAAVSANPWSAKTLADGGGVIIVDGTDGEVIKEIIGSESYELFTVITSDALIESDPELVQKAVNAIAKAMKWMESATPEQIAEKMLPLFDGAEEELLYDAQYDKEHQVASYTGYHTLSGFQAAINLTKLAGGITGDPTEDQIYDESFLDDAWQSMANQQ